MSDDPRRQHSKYCEAGLDWLVVEQGSIGALWARDEIDRLRAEVAQWLEIAVDQHWQILEPECA